MLSLSAPIRSFGDGKTDHRLLQCSADVRTAASPSLIAQLPTIHAKFQKAMLTTVVLWYLRLEWLISFYGGSTRHHG